MRTLNIKRDHLENFSFVLPALVIFVVFYVYPFVEMFFLSFHDWHGMGAMHFIGLQNYKELIKDSLWWDSMGHAAYITTIALIFQNALAFALALACDQQIRMRQFYRLVFFIPPVLSEIVVGLVWNWILNPEMQNGQPIGWLNHGLYHLGFPGLMRHWLSDPATALSVIAIVNSWKGFGWGFLMLLAGLQGIDKQFYEVARMDGAGGLKIFTAVTLPLMLPVILVVMILTVLGCMQVFVLILGLVNQGLVYHTDVPVTRIFSSMQTTYRFGYACAQAVSFGMTLVAVSFIMKKLTDTLKRA